MPKKATKKRKVLKKKTTRKSPAKKKVIKKPIKRKPIKKRAIKKKLVKKKIVKKKVIKKKPIKKQIIKKEVVKKQTPSKPVQNNNVNLLIKNSINLQKTVLTLVESTNNLTRKVGGLVNLFEEAAKNIDKIKEVESKDVELLSQRLREVVTQNKDLANALVLLEENIRKGRYSPLKHPHLR